MGGRDGERGKPQNDESALQVNLQVEMGGDGVWRQQQLLTL